MYQEGQKSKKCNKCKDYFNYMPSDTYWQEFGTYSGKLVKCPNCGTINVIKYVEAAGLHVNTDKRYY